MPSEPFEEFVEKATPLLLGRARALTADPHDAWDLVQETLVRVGERWHRLDDPPAYASTVLTRLNIDRIRRLRRDLSLRQRLAPPDSVPPPTDGPDAWLVDALQGGDLEDGESYVEHPHAELYPDHFRVPYADNAVLPKDARSTGYERNGRRVWLAPDHSRAFVGSSPASVSVWPRVVQPLGCA